MVGYDDVGVKDENKINGKFKCEEETFFLSLMLNVLFEYNNAIKEEK